MCLVTGTVVKGVGQLSGDKGFPHTSSRGERMGRTSRQWCRLHGELAKDGPQMLHMHGRDAQARAKLGLGRLSPVLLYREFIVKRQKRVCCTDNSIEKACKDISSRIAV